MSGRSERVIPQCPGEGCENRDYEPTGMFGNLVCTECGYMPFKPRRDKIKEAMGIDD